MNWLYDVSYVLGGAVLTNAVPHIVRGVTGHPFQTPFATPPGRGLSSATVNVLWGVFNLAVGYLLVLQVGAFDPRSPEHAVAAGLGILLSGVMLSRIFGPLHGGAAPRP